MTTTRLCRIAVAIATYRRPELLATLLESLHAQRLRSGQPVQIIVVDNDPQQTAQKVCDASRVPVLYETEHRPGISYARNKGVNIALREDCDAIAFIDDDERADPGWLQRLIETAETYDADIVAGPVIPEFPPDAPRWIVRQRWFDRKAYKTGQPVRWPATNNSLVRRTIISELDGDYFDVRFALTGGEDTDFYLRCHERGARSAWAQEAVVRESIPHARLNIRWIWRRGVRLGNISGINLRRHHHVFTVLIIGVGRVCFGLIAALPVLVFRQSACAAILGHIPRGVGVISGIFGLPIVEYARPSPSKESLQ